MQAVESKLDFIYPSLSDKSQCEKVTISNGYQIFKLIKSRDKTKFSSEFMNILSTVDPMCLNEEKQYPLMYACKIKKWSNAKLMLQTFGSLCLSDNLDKDGNDILYYARYDADIFNMLLTYKKIFTSFNRKYQSGYTLLMSLLIAHTEVNYSSVIEEMTTETLNHTNCYGETALIIACKESMYSTALLIINTSVKLSNHDSSGNSAITHLFHNLKLLQYNMEKKIEEVNVINISSNILHVCLRLITKANRRNSGTKNYTREIKRYDDSQFIQMVDVGKSKGTYGSIKWAIDSKTGEHKMLKHYHNFKGYNLINEDIIKEFILLRKMNENNDYSVRVDGIYMDGDSDFYLVMEPLAMNLYQFFKLVKINPELLNSKVVSIFEQLKDYILKMHSLGILHNDIKLENIMIGYDGKVKICDFGISEFIGYSPNRYVMSHYITTKYISAPDYDHQIIFDMYDNNIKLIGEINVQSNRKSYSSDIYSLGVSFIQGIFSHNSKFISIGGIIYCYITDGKIQDENTKKIKEHSKLPIRESIKKISDEQLEKLSSFSIYSDLVRMIDIDSNLRINRPSKLNETKICKYNKPENSLFRNIIHYSPDEIKNHSNELVYFNEIFKNYKNLKIKMNKRNNSINYRLIFDEIFNLLPKSISLDTILNAITHTINYPGREDVTIVFISYMYIFSYLFEWYEYDLIAISNKLSIDLRMLTNKINNTIIYLIPTVQFIPYVLLTQRVVILSQISNIEYQEKLHEIETVVFNSLIKYFLSIAKSEELDIWEFIQAVLYSKGLLPFEYQCNNLTILEIFNKL